MEMLSPGVYPKETDFSAYVRAQSTSTAGFVGIFEKGPIGKATLVTSLEDARRQFGGFVDGHHGMFALNAFFTNGGARAFVVRTARYVGGVLSALRSSATLVDRAGTPLDTLKVSALSEGTWGNSISVEVTASEAFPSTGFNMIVRAGEVVETFKDLVLTPSSDDYVEKRINGTSELVIVEDLVSVSAAPNNRPVVAVTALVGGVSGLTGLAAADFIGDAAAGTGLSALDSVDVNMIAVPGESVATAIAVAMKDYAENRKDCVAILDVAQGATAQQMVDQRSSLNINSSYAAMYGPWLDAAHPVTSRTIKVAPSGVVAGIFARNDQVGAVWTAPAGLNRATVRGVLDAERRLSKGERDLLQSKQVNPIAVVAGTLAVYGQMTMQIKASATDRINVRRLMAFVEKSVVDAAQFVVFEANDKRTWEQFKRTVNPFLQRIKDDGAFYDFITICDETVNTPANIDANIMKARIMVKPTKTAEYISVEFAIASTGANFSEL
jgi:uncharacterized protein